ncbi:DCL family protein [Psychromonas hadalis]|uniref:DCL family protein n=1 Tax=Psychromonas hadalis TaxID=211669 RepID=UPI0003B51C70|nr:DCL family protein [Psychromonas hadalis]
MASHKVILPSQIFSSKKDAKAFFKTMLNTYIDGEEITGFDDQLLYELVQRHQSLTMKRGVGIKGFYKDKSPEYKTSCFHLERTDGIKTDFSYHRCIDASNPTLDQEFYNACRYAVSEKLTNRKKEIFDNGPVHCVKTNELLAFDTSEYRHTIPRFRDIVSEFKKIEHIELTSDIFVDDADMQYITKFSDNSLAIKFDNFHTEIAKLELYKKYER